MRINHWKLHKDGVESTDSKYYYIEFADIIKDGVEDWVDHMRKKSWFNPEVELEFRLVVLKYKQQLATC